MNKYKMKTIYYALVLISFFSFLVCEKNKNPLSPEPDQFIYPIKIGNQWEYNRIFFFFNRRPDFIMTQDTIFSLVVMEITREKILNNSIKTYLFLEAINEMGSVFTGESYYTNQKDGLYRYAYRYKSTSLVIPKTNLKNKILFKGRYFNNVSDITYFLTKMINSYNLISDSIIYETPPLLAIKYPLAINSQWTYRVVEQRWYIDKKIITKEIVQVPAGKFDCYKIQWLYDFDNNSQWDDDIIFYDYICNKGLIKRSMIFKDCVATNETGDSLGLFDVKDESVLVKLKLY